MTHCWQTAFVGGLIGTVHHSLKSANMSEEQQLRNSMVV